MENVIKDRPIKLRNLLAYGSGDVFGGGSFAVLGLWIMFFYTTYAGLSPVQAGAIIAIARLLDAISDPLMGYVTDNFYRNRWGQRFGRRGFFFLIGSPLVLVTYICMWVDGMGFGYYLTTYVLFYLTYTLVIVPYETLAAEMTSDFKVRAKLTGVRMLFSTGAGILAAWLPGRIIAYLGEDASSSFLYMGVIFGILFAIVIVLLYCFTWSRPVPISQNMPPLSFRRDMRDLFKSLISTFHIKTFRLHVGMYLGAYVALDVLGSVLVYYIVFVLGQNAIDASNALTLMTLVQFLCVSLFIPLCIRFGNGAAYKIAQSFMLVSIALFLMIYLVSPANAIYWIALAAVVMGCGRAGSYYVCWNIYSFIPDVDEIFTGQRREGIFAGVMTFVRKAVQALALFMVGLALQHSGFIAKSSSQPTEAIHGIAMVFCIGSVLFLLFGLLCARKFRLTIDNHRILVEEINRLKQGGSMSTASAETRQVVETLTGWDYRFAWGNNSIINRPTTLPIKEQQNEQNPL
ncbi:MFS transporter [Serratia proteamaculans]|uniref:MFS transporter n=1 Tax=Serratia proteamaculans TaxID=28151 RepID=UPI00217A03CC|nr:MFS transporter [Serratia proteamaculans]CAI1923175.1 Inner membrane symporter yicJ [Serratia proteamaculans]